MVFFDQNTQAGEWRAQARCCEEQNIALHRNIAFALAVADLLQLPDDLPLMPAVTAAMSIPICLRDPASLAHLRAVARAAARNGAGVDAPSACTSFLSEPLIWRLPSAGAS